MDCSKIVHATIYTLPSNLEQMFEVFQVYEIALNFFLGTMRESGRTILECFWT